MMRDQDTRARKRGFTLLELLVVVALIALLVTVIVPVVVGFMKGRGLGMIGNNVSGFIAFARSEAMNRRQPHVIVYYFENEQVPTGGMFERHAGPGMVLFRVDPKPRQGEQQFNYVRHLNFGGQIGAVDFAGSWKGRASVAPIQESLGSVAVTSQVNEQFRGKYKLAIHPDGRLSIPDDKAGYVLDSDNWMDLDQRVDLVLTDGDRFVFIDINNATGAVRRSPIINQHETNAKP
jgi:prepilin-type N-terminal cleavage/methylation domain-containing protein